MNKKVTAAVVLVIVILAAWFFMRGKQTKAPDQVQKESAKSEIKSVVEEKSLKQLLAAGGSKTCSFTTEETNVKSRGEIYIGTGKMRGDFTADTDGKSLVSHMISDAKEVYIWTDNPKTGFKMNMESMASPVNKTSSGSMDVEKPYAVNCSDWSVDSTKFTLPTDIQFMDSSSINPNNQSMSSPSSSGTPEDNSAMKAMLCGKLAEPQRSACLGAIAK